MQLSLRTFIYLSLLNLRITVRRRGDYGTIFTVTCVYLTIIKDH